MIERVCQTCEKTYQTFPSIKPKYCSSACAGIAKRSGETVPCQQCGEPYYRLKGRPNSLYCSKSCARTAANLTAANPSFSRDISGEKNPMFGKGMAGEKNPMFGKKGEACPRWKGGLKRRKDGYMLSVVPDDHPHPSDTSSTGTKYVLLHRLVMEEHIGRYLNPGEVVHHIDGDPSNNTIENLELFASHSEHLKARH